MAFPTTSVLDNFNRSDEGPPPSASWAADPYNDSEPGLEVVSNQVRGSAWELCSSYYSASTYGEDSEAYVTVVDLPADSAVVMLGCRIQDPDSANVDAYVLEYTQLDAPDTDEWKLYRVVNDAWTQLGATVEQDLSAGDKIGLEAIGSTIKAYQYTGGSWSEVMSRSDSNVSGAGYLALSIQNADRDCDDFGGGTVVAAASAMPMAVDSFRRWRN
jgi:hypothetical protein